MNIKTTAEERAKMAQCRSCFGRGMLDPTCYRCGDSTDDHECPPKVTCQVCKGSGDNPEARRTLDDVDTLLAEVDRLRARNQATFERAMDLAEVARHAMSAGLTECERLRGALREACTHLDMAVEASEESGDLDKEEVQEEREFIGRCRAALGDPPTADKVTQNLVEFSRKNFP